LVTKGTILALSAEQLETLITETAAGMSVCEVAKRLGCCSRTITRRLKSADVQQRILARRVELVQATVGTLAAASQRAALTLFNLLGDRETSAIRLAAARAVLEHTFRGAEIDLLARQIAELREQMENQAHGPNKPAPASSEDQAGP
jgi:hypothetical protein